MIVNCEWHTCIPAINALASALCMGLGSSMLITFVIFVRDGDCENGSIVANDPDSERDIC